MAESNNARGSVRASARKGARKSAPSSTPKVASKPSKTTRSKSRAAQPAPQPTATAPAVPSAAAPRVQATIPTAERLRMIAEAAYYRSQRRGFAPSDPHRDWLEAEAEIDAMLLRRLSDG